MYTFYNDSFKICKILWKSKSNDLLRKRNLPIYDFDEKGIRYTFGRNRLCRFTNMVTGFQYHHQK